MATKAPWPTWGSGRRGWAGLIASGALDSGRPLEPGGKVVEEDAVADFQPEDIGIGGYLIINAESLDDAARIMQGSPHMALGGSAIVRPCLDIS